MRRLGSRIIWDVRLQFRNGFYYAAAAVVLLMVIVLAWLPDQSLPWVLPVVLLGNLVTNGFYFVGGLVLLEKGEGSLEAQVVTPLRDWEYLFAKGSTLVLLSLIESLIIVALVYDAELYPLTLVAGVVLMTAFLVFTGFLVVARYDSINEYLFPSFFITMLLAIPLLDYFDVVSSKAFYLHPLQASLILMRGGLEPISATELVYGLAYGTIWVVISFGLCLHTFNRFVIARQGVH